MFVLPTLVLGLLLQASSPAVKPEKPVIKNGTTTTSKKVAAKNKKTNLPPSEPGVVGIPSTPEGQPEKEHQKGTSGERVYSVKVVSEPTPPEPKDTPLFGWYLLAIALGVLVNALIWFAIFRQTQLNRIVATAAKDSAKAANDSAVFTEKTIKLTERADVLLDSADVATSERGHILPNSSVNLRFKNFGRTRAINVRFEIKVTVPDGPDITPIALPELVIGAGMYRR